MSPTNDCDSRLEQFALDTAYPTFFRRPHDLPHTPPDSPSTLREPLSTRTASLRPHKRQRTQPAPVPNHDRTVTMYCPLDFHSTLSVNGVLQMNNRLSPSMSNCTPSIEPGRHQHHRPLLPTSSLISSTCAGTGQPHRLTFSFPATTTTAAPWAKSSISATPLSSTLSRRALGQRRR